jgi:Holliday junction resolvase
MSLLLIERGFIEQLQSSSGTAVDIEEVREETSVEELCSFLRAFKNKAYVLVTTDDDEALFKQARALGMPPDGIVEIARKQNHQF